MMKRLYLTVIALVMMSAGSAKAQISIGSSAASQPFSVLELFSNETRGLRLPQFNLCEQETLTNTLKNLPTTAEKAAAQGLQIFNTSNNCVETWNGSKWIQQCTDGPIKNAAKYQQPGEDYFQDLDKIGYAGVKVLNKHNNMVAVYPFVGCDAYQDDKITLMFLPYNLGADPYIAGEGATAGDIAKAQMDYHKISTDPNDVTVYGGLFQWGRKDFEHASRYNKDDTPCCFTEDLYTDNVGTNPYKPDESFKYVYGSNVVSNSGDWITPHNNALWGNGEGLNGQYKILNENDNSINNPCPEGYHVPTQHEWALLGWEGGNAINTNNDEWSSIDATGTLANSCIYWVPVADGVASKDWEDNQLCGYALYDKQTWEDAKTQPGYFYPDGASGIDMTKPLTAADAPDPIIFLPAAGFRDNGDGSFQGVGTSGNYWSSTIDNNSSYSMLIDDNQVSVTGASNRAYGFSVRCVKKAEEEQ
ncbi:MAG: fibrobacter succinogenes major paralogous domain-containing protein [Dysgonamonadaceae bacterium]|jgi:hypothetical protein|nr:fibrobacter succinogenes major paralogous domain-containing protein [Dysgonamonadaceae bacterium]